MRPAVADIRSDCEFQEDVIVQGHVVSSTSPVDPCGLNVHCCRISSRRFPPAGASSVSEVTSIAAIALMPNHSLLEDVAALGLLLQVIERF